MLSIAKSSDPVIAAGSSTRVVFQQLDAERHRMLFVDQGGAESRRQEGSATESPCTRAKATMDAADGRFR